MLSSAADLTWLLQDITESYCMNSQEARQKLTVQIKGIVNAKISICWKLLTLRPSKMSWVCFFIWTDLEKFRITSLSYQWILCSEWVPSQWESKQLIKHHNNPRDSLQSINSTSYEMRSCMIRSDEERSEGEYIFSSFLFLGELFLMCIFALNSHLKWSTTFEGIIITKMILIHIIEVKSLCILHCCTLSACMLFLHYPLPLIQKEKREIMKVLYGKESIDTIYVSTKRIRI